MTRRRSRSSSAPRLLCWRPSALIRDPAESTPIVLAGSLAGDASPVGAELRTLLAARFAGAVLPARNGVGGAAWLALAALDPALATRETHARLTS